MNKKLFLSMCVAPVAAMAFQVGAWVGGPGQYPQPTQQNVQAFQDLQGTHLDLISYFALFDINDWNATEEYANVAKENGSTLVVTWMANGYNAQDLVDGKADTYIRDYAKGVKNYGEEIWLRPLHEANGDWYDWGVGKAGAGNTDANVAEAFRHIVNIFREENVTNVKWVWTTNASNAGTGTTLTGNYPGDEYVDYISIDGYNWGKCQSWSSWQTFTQVFKKAYNALANIDKPLFIAEISSSELGGNKAEWITDMFEHFTTDFSRVFAVMWFSQSKEANEGDWALNTSQAAVDAWKAGIAKMKALESNTAIKPTGRAADSSFRLQDGKLYVQTDKALKASVVQFDYQGRILWQSAVQHFTPGVHAIDAPEANTRSIYKLSIKQ
ncbi:Glycosyl hydrolase family 26 [Fibrobacter sp. UWT2]|uniref:glycoside hydrolase family 26 protein n=1 Tax=Fibrobacter sp. UWT2 TaxID=1896224 RepID=UPI000920F5C0|nr:glycosyl hydrolase [Fibrobacter sp. UWT2]SHL69801.1 Glycosyl hydrolase family 26 [Fibrobacter sp. UWT2]